MQSLKNFIILTLLLIVIQISYVLGASSALRTLVDPAMAAKSNWVVNNPLEQSDLRLLRRFEVEDESDSQLRQKRQFGGYGGGGFGHHHHFHHRHHHPFYHRLHHPFHHRHHHPFHHRYHHHRHHGGWGR